MNLLAAAAALGVLVVVFQFGSGLHVLTSASRTSRIMIALLFSPSLDYEVFFVSRIREKCAATSDNLAAVRTGQATAGRVIAAAAS